MEILWLSILLIAVLILIASYRNGYKTGYVDGYDEAKKKTTDEYEKIIDGIERFKDRNDYYG